MNEQQLISGLKSGDEAAFDQFFERYRNTIYNFGLRFCGNEEDASDVLQDTLINTFKYIKNFKGTSKLSTWLYRVASNACLMKRRKERGQDVSLHDLEETSHEPAGDSRMGPGNQLEQKELNQVIEEAVLKLPETYRIAFLLRDIENLSHQEIAKILGTSQSNAKVRVHRARLMLRDMVADYLQGKAT